VAVVSEDTVLDLLRLPNQVLNLSVRVAASRCVKLPEEDLEGLMLHARDEQIERLVRWP
jgi:hypothetical protein